MFSKQLFKFASSKILKKLEQDYCSRNGRARETDYLKLKNILFCLNFSDQERIELMQALCCDKGWSFTIKEMSKNAMN